MFLSRALLSLFKITCWMGTRRSARYCGRFLSSAIGTIDGISKASPLNISPVFLSGTRRPIRSLWCAAIARFHGTVDLLIAVIKRLLLRHIHLFMRHAPFDVLLWHVFIERYQDNRSDIGLIGRLYMQRSRLFVLNRARVSLWRSPFFFLVSDTRRPIIVNCAFCGMSLSSATRTILAITYSKSFAFRDLNPFFIRHAPLNQG